MNDNNKNWFPLLIELFNSEGILVREVMKHSHQIPIGVAFRVIQTNYKG